MADPLTQVEESLERAYGDKPGPTVPRVEVVLGNDSVEAIAARFMNRIDSVFESGSDRAARRYLPQFEARMRERPVSRLTASIAVDEARVLVDEVLQALKQDLLNRVQTDLAVHLVPLIKKEQAL